MRRMTSSLRKPAVGWTVFDNLCHADAAHLVHMVAAHVLAADIFGVDTQKKSVATKEE